MKTKIHILLFLFSLFWILNIANANVDVTNISSFKYDCTSTWWVLHTDFSLWWHHHYKRDYKIDSPWIIEISDVNHTTISKNLWASIGWCNYHVSNCNISSWWNWGYDSEKIESSINIQTDLDIIKNWNIISIDSHGWHSHGPDSIIITYNWHDHDFTWEDISIDLQNNKIILTHNSTSDIIETFSNNTYVWQDEFYYNISSDNKIILLKKRIFKKTWIWSTPSSNNINEYSAFNWVNVWFTLSSTANTQWPDYTTWLNYWDFTQHIYTTTKVKLNPVNLTCSKIEYSDGKTDFHNTSYNWTLNWIIQSIFDWTNMKINWWLPNKMFADKNIKLSWIYYATVWEIWWVKDQVNQVTLTIKKDEFTKWVSTININPSKWESNRDFWNLAFVLKNKTATCSNWNETSCIDANNIPAENYWMELIFKYNWNKIGDLATGLVILPNNDYTPKSWTESFSPSATLYANWNNNYSFCQNITDSFGNTYLDMWTIDVTPNYQFYLDQINNIWDWLYIYNNTFNSSKICFDIKSYSPWSKDITFQAKFPVYDLDWNISSYKQLSFTKEITFLKPFITTDLSITNANKKLEIWPSLNMWLSIITKSSLSFYEINNFKDDIKLASNDHVFKKWPTSIIDSNNLKYSFTIDAANTTWLNNAPGIELSNNPVISYTIDLKNIKYYINTSTNPNNNDKLSLLWVKWISWIKVVWTSQTSWKSATTNNIVNFSDLSKSTMRASVKKNAAIITKWMKSWDLVNKVLYYDLTNSTDKNIEYSNIKSKDFETLVIKNWNFIINENINKEKLWIIVLKDWYNVSLDYNKIWNIYITPDVTYIKASIYADGWLISSNSSGNPYISDTDIRTNALENQLVIKWSILTRNTIGWAVNAGWQYILPGWQETSVFDQAMIYDLNYLRRSNNWWGSQKDKNNNNSNNVVIIYNPSIQTNPPKWFSSN